MINDTYSEEIMLSGQFRDIFNKIPSGICLYRYHNSKVTAVLRNDAFFTIFGESLKSKLTGSNIADLDRLHPDDVNVFRKKFIQCLEERGRLSYNYRVLSNTQKQYAWIHIDAYAFEQQGDVYMYANYFDVSEQMQNEQTLNNIVNSITGGFAIYEMGDTVKTVMATDGIPKMQGYTREEYDEITKENALAIVYEEDRTMLEEKMADAVLHNDSFHVSYRVKCKNRDFIWVNLSAFPTNHSSDTKVIYNAVFTSVSEQFDIYQHIVDNSDDGAVVLDEITHEVYYANPIAMEMMGRRGESYAGKNCYELLGNANICEGCRLSECGNSVEHQRTASGRVLQIKTHKIVWLGRKATVRYLIDVTKDYEHQQQLKIEKERYYTIAERSGLAMMDYDLLTKKTYTNHTYGNYAVSQLKAEDITEYEKLMEVVHPGDIELIKEFLEKSKSGAETAEATIRLEMKDGTYRWTIIRGYYFYDENGRQIRQIGTFQDVNDITLQYEELKNRYKYEVAQHGYNDDIVESLTINVNKGQLIDYKSSLFQRHQIIKDGQLEPSYLTEDVEVQDKIRRLCSPEYLIDAFHKGINPSFEYNRLLPNGQGHMWLLSDTRLVREPQSGDLFAFIYAHNIDHRKTVEQMIERVVNVDYEGTLLIANNGTIKYATGYKDFFGPFIQDAYFSEVLDAFIEKHMAPQDREMVRQTFRIDNIKGTLKATDVMSNILSAEFGENTIKVRCTASYFDAEKEYILMSFSDVTHEFLEEQKKNEELSRALKRAETAAKAKTDFLARMSHDMRTPMNGILGIASLLRDRTDPEEIRADLNQIELSGRYLLSLINDTLDMSKIDSGKLSLHEYPIDSKNLYSNVIANVSIQASEKGIALNMEHPPMEHQGWHPVVADASRVEQIFINIISNAIKFTPRGGSVTLYIENLEMTEDTITHRFVITDTGIGMSEEYMKHIFEPFSQEGRANVERESGTGLGLAIVKQIVELMHGQITIQSKLNQGTTVTIELSFKRYHGELEPRNTKTMDWSTLDGKRILLCEDHPINAQIAIRILNKQGVIVEHASNGKIGCEMFAASACDYYDAILMDIRMPIMNGLKATETIRAMKGRADAARIPIIAMTANAFDEDVKQCLDAGMQAHLAKPFEPAKLYSILSTFIIPKQ